MTESTLLMHADAAEAAAAAALFNAALGEGYTSTESLLTLPADGGVLVRALGESLLGAGTARVLTEDSGTALAARLRAAGVNDSRLTTARLGEVKSLAVAPEARGRGIGTSLIQASLDYLRRAECRYAFTASWASGNPEHSSLGILDLAGFERIGTVASFWRDEQQAAGYQCPDCGSACACVAIIMVADLRPGADAGEPRP